MGLSGKHRSSQEAPARKRRIRIGDRYLVKTFAGVDVHTEIVEIESDEKGIYMGKLLRKEDLLSLIKASIPWKKDENPEDCVGVVYDFQIIKKINKRKKRPGKKRYVREKVNN